MLEIMIKIKTSDAIGHMVIFENMFGGWRMADGG